MKKEKICAILYYTAAVCFYLAVAIKFLSGNDTSMGGVWLCLGSTMLCLGSVWMNKMKKNDPASRPAIARKRDNMDEYDTVFVRFPIWWFVAPTIINTFLESYELAGKTIIPFATSGGSGMGKTNEKLSGSCKGAKLVDGKVLKANVSAKEIADWVRTDICRLIVGFVSFNYRWFYYGCSWFF